HAGGLEADDETLFRIPGSDAVVSSAPEEADDKAAPDLTCRVCSLRFETRRGLSSHARSHLRQLGVSEGSGAPINLLYRVIQERLGPPDPAAPGRDPDLEDDMDFEEKPLPLSILAKMAPSPSSSLTSVLMGPPGAYPPRLLSSVVRKAPVSSLLPVSSPLRSPDHKGSGVKAVTSHLSLAGNAPSTKPFWAPQESDAPLNLTLEGDPSKDIICHLCGAWFETRKGLSSHARAHLRHFGVEYSESKGSPITLLNQLIHTDDFKHKASVLQATPPGPHGPASKRPLLASSSLLFKGAGGSPSSKATSMSSLLGPPAKRPKSSIQVFRLSSGELLTLPHNEPPKEIGCEFCGEFFENRKGLSSHARSHLRQMGITEWSVNGSPIDTLREVIATRGLPCALPLKPRKTPPPSSPGPPRSPLAAASSSPPASAPLLGRLPFAFARPSSPHPTAGCRTSRATPPSAPPLSSSGGVVLKPKPEPEPLEVTMPGAVGASGGLPAEPLNCSWNSSDNLLPLNLVVSHETEPPREIQCEFCGEFFENRKGLSSHARSHLRQMGITEWSVNGSPIDTLREVMTKRGDTLPPDQGVKKEAGRRGAASPVWGDHPGGPGSSEGPGGPGFQLTKFRKSPLSLLHSRLQKQGAAVGGLAPGGKGLQGPPLGSRAPLEEPGPAGQAPTLLPKALAALPPGFLFKRKASPDKHGASPQDASCELCGFYFENRKALASHARAHLRQFGVTEWCVNGSPIETLSAWMRTRPQKVLEMHRSYMQVNRSSLKKIGKAGHHLQPPGDRYSRAPPPASRRYLPLPLDRYSRAPPPASRRYLPLPLDRYSRAPPPASRREVIQKLLASLVSVVLCELVSLWFSSLTLVCSSSWFSTSTCSSSWFSTSTCSSSWFSTSTCSSSWFSTSTCSSSWQKNVSPLSPSPDHLISIPALKPSSSGSSPWSSLAPPRPPRSDRSEFLSPPLHATPKAGPGGRSPSRQGPGLPLHAQVARSELNVRLPRGFERRPLKHPSLPEGAERESAPRPPRSGTIPSLVPHPPSYPLVKLVGALYTLKCRFCEVEFQGPLSIQEDWIRHLQQHIIKMNYSKPDGPRGPASTDPPTPRGPASTDPPTPRGPASTDTTTPKGPASTDLTTTRGPASTDPTTPRGPASTDPPTPRGSASSDTKTPKGPTSNGPAPPSGLSSPQPATLRAPGSTDPPTHRGATDPPTQQPPATTDSAPPRGPRSTHPAKPRAPPPPSPPAAPHSAQAEGLSAGAPAQDEEGSSPEEGPVPVGGPTACVSTSSTAAAVAPPSDPPSQRPPAQGVPTVPGPQGPEFPEEQPMTDSAPAPGPSP
ncbi:unnamed protein product, partial [Boreogadus saida]